MKTFGMLLIYGVTYGTLSWLSWREWSDRQRRVRREARRLPRIDVDPPRINTIRRDPSPKSKQRAS